MGKLLPSEGSQGEKNPLIPWDSAAQGNSPFVFAFFAGGAVFPSCFSNPKAEPCRVLSSRVHPTLGVSPQPRVVSPAGPELPLLVCNPGFKDYFLSFDTRNAD